MMRNEGNAADGRFQQPANEKTYGRLSEVVKNELSTKLFLLFL